MDAHFHLGSIMKLKKKKQCLPWSHFVIEFLWFKLETLYNAYSKPIMFETLKVMQC
jgi:hypothetical protein